MLAAVEAGLRVYDTRPRKSSGQSSSTAAPKTPGAADGKGAPRSATLPSPHDAADALAVVHLPHPLDGPVRPLPRRRAVDGKAATSCRHYRPALSVIAHLRGRSSTSSRTARRRRQRSGCTTCRCAVDLLRLGDGRPRSRCGCTPRPRRPPVALWVRDASGAGSVRASDRRSGIGPRWPGGCFRESSRSI